VFQIYQKAASTSKEFFRLHAEHGGKGKGREARIKGVGSRGSGIGKTNSIAFRVEAESTP
jgi:hypothetical protein